MTAESLKSFISLPSHSSQCSNNRYANGNKIRFISFAVFIVLFCSAILGLEIWNSIRTTQLTQEVEQLKNALDEMKHRFGFDVMEDFDDFENSYDHTESGNDSFGGIFDDSDNDDEFIYDDEEEGSTDFEKEDDYEHDENMYEDNVSQRQTRSLTSPYGVPIVEESYAVKRNRTDPDVDSTIDRILLNRHRPTMQHDWNDRKIPASHNQPSHSQHRSSFSFPKKYQQHRSPPTEYVSSPYRLHGSRTADEHNSHQYATQHTNPQELASPKHYSVRRGRVMSTHEDKSKAFRQIIKKSEYERLLRNGLYLGDENTNVKPIPVHKISRGRSARQNRVKSIAIHYSGDTSKYEHGRHENFDGNGRLRHAGGVYTDWEASPWVNILSMDRFFKLEKGIVTIQENGLYYVYAQIFYHDDHDTNGFIVQHNAQPFLQCTTMTHSTQRVTKSNTCFTGGIAYMRNGDTVHLSDLGNHRYTLFEPAKSFFGLIKMGDARPLHETLE